MAARLSAAIPASAGNCTQGCKCLERIGFFHHDIRDPKLVPIAGEKARTAGGNGAAVQAEHDCSGLGDGGLRVASFSEHRPLGITLMLLS